MIFHICSHWGDIEVEAHGDDASTINYFKLTPIEREGLDAYLKTLGLERSGSEGNIVVPHTVVKVGADLGEHIHGNARKLTAIRFSNGEVQVTRENVVPWYQRLMDKFKGAAQDMTTTMVHSPLVPAPVAAVQTPVPKRGCPMPDMTELREQKAAGVVRKFLIGQQIPDFNKRRGFVAVGCDTGRLYRVTSRWSPDVEKYGVLHDITRGRRVCASNKKVPPSEEVLSMKFVVENMEEAFLNGPHG